MKKKDGTELVCFSNTDCNIIKPITCSKNHFSFFWSCLLSTNELFFFAYVYVTMEKIKSNRIIKMMK